MTDTRHSKRMERIRRRNRRRKRILYTSMVVILFIIILVIALIVKGCSSGSKNKTNENMSEEINTEINTSPSDIKETESAGEAVTTEAVTEKEGETAQAAQVSAKGYKIENIDGVTYVDGVLIANKTYALPSTFIPTDPAEPVTEDKSNTSLDKTLMSAWKKMLSDATAKGLNIYISSGYRSYNYQVLVYNTYVKSDGVEKADTYSSRPGNSEHQTGLCFDLNTIEDSFQYTEEGKWINDNCYKYGFCIRFPKGKDEYTGYQYESWHLRYVGVDLATKLYNNGDWLSLEEYFGITSKYPD